MHTNTDKIRPDRQHWEGRLISMHDEPEVEMVSGAPDELMELCLELSELSFAMSEKALPSYSRSEMPGRLYTQRSVQ